MTLVSLTDCCHLLAIDPKTLRRWMRLFQLEALQSPLDARCKCLTREQLQQLATAHHRTLETNVDPHLQAEISGPPTPAQRASATVLSHVGKKQGGAPLSMIIHILGLLLKRLLGLCIVRKCVTSPDFSAPITDLTKQLTSLQAHVVALQDQLTCLHCQLQREQQWRASVVSTTEGKSLESSLQSSRDQSEEESSGSSQDLSLDQSGESSLQSSRDQSEEESSGSSQDLSLDQSGGPIRKRQARAAAITPSIDKHRHSHVLPWVEYGAGGKYVVISPEQGLLAFEPDSPEWFAWLSTLSSFRFMGQLGRFTAHRGGSKSPNSSWYATRSIRNRSYNHPLGKTEGLTVAHLDQVAAVLQSHLN